jgi:lipoyl(octanoyl) transferase
MTKPDSAPRCLDLFLLGLVDFDSLLALQEETWSRLVSRRGENTPRGVIFLGEHPLGITFGREATADDLAASETDLRAWSIRTRWLARGGGAILHGPGQLAITAVVPLDAWGWTPGDLRRHLESAIVDLLKEQGIPAQVDVERPGVWTRGGLVAQTGLSVRRGVSQFGIYLNVSPRMDLQRFIRSSSAAATTPISGDPATAAVAPDPVPHSLFRRWRLTSVAAERQRVVAMSSIREGIVRHLARQFGVNDYHVYTGHPQLRRTTTLVDQ